MKTLRPPHLLVWVWEKFNEVFFESSQHRPIQLAVYRIIFASYLLVSNQLPSLRWIPAVPADLRNPPPGLTSWLPHPTPLTAAAIEVTTVLALGGLLVGWRTRSMSILVGVLGIVGSAMIFSFGKIDHTIFLWIVPLAMASSAWGARLSIDSRQGESLRDPVATPAVPFLSLLLALAFLTAGLPKLFGGWLAIDRSATWSYFLDKVVRGETNISTPLWQSLEGHVLWEVADWATLLLEFGFVFLVLWPWGYRILINVAIVFHLTVLFILNINFESSLVLYLIFAIGQLDPGWLEGRIALWQQRKREFAAAGVALFVVAALAQLSGPGLIRVLLAPLGVEDWGVSLMVQIIFFAMILRLTARTIRVPSTTLAVPSFLRARRQRI